MFLCKYQFILMNVINVRALKLILHKKIYKIEVCWYYLTK